MGFRITTWNVNGIRNPFGYQPWRDRRTFEGMFDILEADIVVFQETKIQRKDLRDDMVLVPGWDNYWSLPKHKKGYSGVVIYTRNATCAPIKAEEGITGILTPPNSSISFRDLPPDEQIGGYPSADQLCHSDYDPATLDAEGRCVILEFPAFVLIGTYCPAERDETRTHYRTGFLNVLDARIRNLVKMGKRVIWTGDLNISREEIDSAACEESMRKHGVTPAEWISTPARRMFNQLLVGGKVHGDRDEGREQPIMWDVCRGFHEGRRAMYTCWETKVNARPGNYGARIDYVVCTHDMKDWFSDSNIQEGLMGSDHCPVYGVLKDEVEIDGQERHLSDMVNPPGMFEGGVRKQEWSNKNLLAMSGKLIQEFDKRRSIRDMFTRQPSVSNTKTAVSVEETSDSQGSISAPLPLPPANISNIVEQLGPELAESRSLERTPSSVSSVSTSPMKSAGKRSAKIDPMPAAKRGKTASTAANGNSKSQQSLRGFFAPKNVPVPAAKETTPPDSATPSTQPTPKEATTMLPTNADPSPTEDIDPADIEILEATTTAAKQSWGKLFSKPISPKCDHNEPCKTMLTKKPGMNCGRSFWMCARPLGPSGKKEKNTQWRCHTFIWASDWDTRADENG